MPPQRSSAASIDPASVALQERLHELLSRLSATVDWVRHWPDGQDDPSIHVESTSKLIALIRSVLTAIQSVENTVVRDPKLRGRLQQCLIPMDLIELLDHGSASAMSSSSSSSTAAAASSSGTTTSGGGLNPDAFSRGLLRESLGQLAGLKRRKLALEMLSLDISQRQRKRQQEAAAAAEAAAVEEAEAATAEGTKKRSRTDEETPLVTGDDDGDGAVEEPPAKKQHVS